MERFLMEVSQKGGESLLSTMKFAVLPIAKVFIVCFLGFLMASKYVNILPASGRKLLNGLVFSLLLPCLIFSQLGRAVSVEKIMQWWFIPVNVIVATISGSIIGFIVASIVRPPYPYFKFTIIQIGIGNIGNIPLVLIAALCQDKSNPFGDSAKCNQDGNAYLSFGQWVGAIIVYTYVFQMLSPPPGGSFDVAEVDKLPVKSTPVNEDAPEAPPGGSFDVTEEDKLPFKSTPVNEGAPEQVPLLESEVCESTNTVPSKKRKILDVMYFIYEKLKLRQILQPPVIASIFAIFIGVIPFLKHLILTDDAPLFFFTDSCIILGEAMIPCILLALGGNLVDGPGSSKLGLRTTAAIIFARLVLVPPTGLGFVMLADKLGFLPEGDMMFRFVLLLQYTMPTSVLAGAVANLRGCGREAAAVLFWVHIFAVFSMAGWIVLYLAILF